MQAIPQVFEGAIARWVQHAALPQPQLVPHLLARLGARLLPGEDAVACSGDLRSACRIVACEEPKLPAKYGVPALELRVGLLTAASFPPQEACEEPKLPANYDEHGLLGPGAVHALCFHTWHLPPPRLVRHCATPWPSWLASLPGACRGPSAAAGVPGGVEEPAGHAEPGAA